MHECMKNEERLTFKYAVNSTYTPYNITVENPRFLYFFVFFCVFFVFFCVFLRFPFPGFPFFSDQHR